MSNASKKKNPRALMLGVGLDSDKHFEQAGFIALLK
jgi:hypothetical protein